MSPTYATLYVIAMYFTLSLIGCTEQEPAPTSSVPDTNEPIVEVEGVRFTGEVTYKTLDANLDGFSEALVADVEVDIHAGGK